MKERHSIIRFSALAALPTLAVQGGLAPFWFAHGYAHSGWLPSVAVLFTGLVAPIYLAALACRLVQRRHCISVPLGLGVLFAVLALDFFLDYTLWGVSSGHFRTPDEGTIEVFYFMAMIAVLVFALPPLMALTFRHVFFPLNRKV